MFVAETMYQLTVDESDTVAVTELPNRAAAHGRLMRHVVTGDYYLQILQVSRVHTTYELRRLAADRLRPHIVGHAVIERLDPGRRPSRRSDVCAVDTRVSGNPQFEDFAVRAAQYWRVFVSAVPNHTAADRDLGMVGLRLDALVSSACQAAAVG